MPRAAVEKIGVNVRLPAEVVRHVDLAYYQTGLDRATRALAGLVAFECCDPVLRGRMIEWATRLGEGSATWADLQGHIEKAKAAALDQKKLRAALEQALEQPKKSSERRGA
jgi:hypothetical protein